MKRICTTLTTLLIVFGASSALAQTRPTPAELQKLLDSLRPTTEHKELAQLEGRWNLEGTFLMGGPPMKTTGSVTNRMILDGRFLVSEGTSNNPAGFGDPAIGLMSIYGFDRRTSEFTIVGFDTMGTYYVTAAGKKTPDGKMVMEGETLEHEGGTAVTRKYEMTLKVIDANTYLTEVIFKFPGLPDQTIVSMTHRRAR
jgi:hypothetical protein